MPTSSIPSASDSTSSGGTPAQNAGAIHTQIARETEAFLSAVESDLQQWFAEQEEAAIRIDPAAQDLVAAIAALSTGGKRTRAQLLYWGWRAAGGPPTSVIPVQAAAGLELFQTAALIHDDVVDRSDTRRSMPSVHKRMEHLHVTHGWEQDPAHFGVSSAILIGDLALTWSEQLFGRALAEAGHPSAAAADFNLMRTQVMIGQYLDVHAEVAAANLPADQAHHRALNVLRYKSAKYSAEHPVALGVLLAQGQEATESAVEGFRSFALALGEAYQIRDDILGIFGDPQTTGKPAGDDLREGKRTVVIAVHLERATAEQAAAVLDVLGEPDCTEAHILAARQAITDSGALQAVEETVDDLTARAADGINALDLDPVVAQAFHRILQAAVRRNR
ncbi:polyprenyl synthetase family protein [Kocuria sp.]|uniref:polyprenyl synthetase family protein n=1 Tax=Kocuria sp. TaxID=1871328 RepID=UPI0026DEB0F2|nr:polyprenyl synthetase family protein [Kocuria sp.]MDO5618463.1 polyprenyl synthetase family protein [Kocuria sp.]